MHLPVAILCCGKQVFGYLDPHDKLIHLSSLLTDTVSDLRHPSENLPFKNSEFAIVPIF